MFFIYVAYVNNYDKMMYFVAVTVKITTKLLAFTGYLIIEWCGGPIPLMPSFNIKRYQMLKVSYNYQSRMVRWWCTCVIGGAT